MKAILFLAVLMPLGVLAQPININNNLTSRVTWSPASSACK